MCNNFLLLWTPPYVFLEFPSNTEPSYAVGITAYKTDATRYVVGSKYRPVALCF